MVNIHAQTADMLRRSFEEWGWFDGLRGRGAETLFITDDDLAVVAREALGADGCTVVALSDLVDARTNGVQEAIFFCREKERLLSRKFSSEYPAILATSATYDYMPAGVVFGTFSRASHADAVVKLINVIVAAPAAGADDLTALMEDNKVSKVHKILSHSLLWWVQQQSDFQMLRYLKGIGDCFSDDKIDILVETDILSAITAHTALSWDMLFPKQPVIPMNVLYFMRRAKIAQALDLALERGFPTEGAHTFKPQNIQHVDAATVDAWIEVLLRLEIEIESAMTAIKKMKNITAEDLYGAPDNVLPDAGAFFKRGVRKKRDYSAVYKAIDKTAAMAPQVQEHNRRMIDRLGLVVSDQGSFTSITNKHLLD